MADPPEIGIPEELLDVKGVCGADGLVRGRDDGLLLVGRRVDRGFQFL